MSVLGAELVTNGGFTGNATGWTLTGNWAYNSNNVWAISAGSGNLTQAISELVAGRTYRITFNATITDDASASGSLGGTAFAVSNGSNSSNVVAGATNTNFVIAATCSFAPDYVLIDNVSVKEISVATEIEHAIWDVLALDSTVSGLVSRRIYPEIIPQNTSLPAIAYSQIAGPRQHDLTATSTMVPSRWQLTVVAETYAELRGLSDAIRGALDNLTNVAGSVVIQCAHFIDENDLTNIVPGTDKLRRYSKAIDFYINYNE